MKIILAILSIIFSVSARAEMPTLSVVMAMDPTATAYYGGGELAKATVNEIMTWIAQQYRAEFGLDLIVQSLELNANVSSTTDPIELLRSLPRPVDVGADVYILLTMRDLQIDGQHFSGYATSGPVCSAYSEAVVKVSLNWSDAQIIEHEIAHTLGVPHDGAGACAAETSSSFIMAPVSSGALHFSSCSVSVVKSVLASGAQCLIDRPPAAALPQLPKLGAGSLSDSWLLALGALWLVFIWGVKRSRK